MKKLEEQRDKELAEVNKKNEERSFKIQIAMALASTAQSAINAYSSAAAIPVIGITLAPIAAGVATAAGLLQVAAIKKQHEAAMANYWDGGYTGPGGKYDIAGYVHKGEFVVTQEALSNPQIRPYVDIIDVAQRNNTVSSLKSTDFSTAMEYREKVAFSPLGSNGIRSKEEQLQNEYLLSVLSQVVDTIAILDKRF
ncbi:phage tail tape measure protein, partial [Dysgonomonas sp. Shenzhen-Wh21]